jgi:hypothetical protein
MHVREGLSAFVLQRERGFDEDAGGSPQDLSTARENFSLGTLNIDLHYVDAAFHAHLLELAQRGMG